MPTILIIGGYGNTGYYLAELLLQHTDAQLILAGRNEDATDVGPNAARRTANVGGSSFNAGSSS